MLDKLLKKGIMLKFRIGRIFDPRYQDRTTPGQDFNKKEEKTIEELTEKGKEAK